MDVAETDELLARYRSSGDRAARNAVIEAHAGIADHIAHRISRTNPAVADDLRQVALLAMVRAADRYRPGHGASFRTFATRTVDGELKRYLRDRTWTVRPPRRPQEQFLAVCRAREELTQELRRAPATSEIAERTGLNADVVLQALEAGSARAAHPLEPTSADGTPSVRRETVTPDLRLSAVEHHLDLRRALTVLDDRERRVLRLRFVDEMSQPAIAELLGISQSYASRIIRGALTKLRADLQPPTAAAVA